jgi:hypothetical protein
MDEDEAILYLLDLGTGASYRSPEVTEKVTEIQNKCGVEEGDEREIKNRLEESDSVTIELSDILKW